MDPEELLTHRSAAAMSLREFDHHTRSLGLRKLVGRAEEDRAYLSDFLMVHGGIPWPYNPDRDNSWLVDV
jgi:hypothetical protein